MKAVKTKLLAALMAAVMIFAMAPLTTDTAHAENFKEITVDGINYVVLFDSGTAYTNGCNADVTAAVIQPEVTYEGVTYPVTKVCSRAKFWNSNILEYVWIPASITTIEYCGFEGCKASTILFEPGSQLTSIADDAFSSCVNLDSIELPEGIKTIPSGALAHCRSLKNITIPDGVTSIAGYALYDNPNLWGATIPGSVTSIGRNAFKDVYPGLTVHYTGTEEQWAAAIDPDWTNVNTTVHCCPDLSYIKATPEADGVIGYACSDGWGMEVGYISRPAKLDLSTTAYTYNGNAMKPKVTVKDAEGSVIDPANYSVSYENNKNAGEAAAIVTFKGDRYDGVMSRTFAINPAKTAAPSGKTLTYNGKEQTGVAAGAKYTVTGNSGTKAGAYKATVTLKDKTNYTWSDGTKDAKTVTWKINKAANPLAVKAKAATVKFKQLKKKNQALTVDKVITFTKKGRGALTYTKASGNKKITINKTTGKVTVKKGLKKNTYKIKVKVKAAGNANYNASAVKTVTFTVNVK